MKASKLVSELQSIINHQGDFEVRIDIGEERDWKEMPYRDEWEVVDVAPDFKFIWLVAR